MNRIAIFLHSVQYDCELSFFTVKILVVVMVTYCFRCCVMNRIAICLHSVQYDCELSFFTVGYRNGKVTFLSAVWRHEKTFEVGVMEHVALHQREKILVSPLLKFSSDKITR